jgi:hypothetical protein
LDRFHKNLQLSLSATIVFSVSLIYGGNPSKILPFFFDFEIQNLELQNIFRGIMGLYIGFASYWIIGILKVEHWKGATISNIIFMGGLAFGRLVSLMFDGVSTQYSIGMLLEFVMMCWGIYNLKKVTQ